MADDKSRIEKIKDFINKCTLLTGKKINTDYLNEKIESYSIDQTPSNPIITKYTDGESRNQLTFDFTVKVSFNALENIKNSKFCEDLTEWIEKQNDIGNLPEIEGIVLIECTSPGYIIQTTETTAVYVIQMRIEYDKEATQNGLPLSL